MSAIILTDRSAVSSPVSKGGGRLPEKLVYDTADLCSVLGMSKAKLFRMKAANKLPRCFLVGGQLRWDAAEIRAWIAAKCPEQKTWEPMWKTIMDAKNNRR